MSKKCGGFCFANDILDDVVEFHNEHANHNGQRDPENAPASESSQTTDVTSESAGYSELTSQYEPLEAGRTDTQPTIYARILKTDYVNAVEFSASDREAQADHIGPEHYQNAQASDGRQTTDITPDYLEVTSDYERLGTRQDAQTDAQPKTYAKLLKTDYVNID